jgi:hypothetical protein
MAGTGCGKQPQPSEHAKVSQEAGAGSETKGRSSQQGAMPEVVADGKTEGPVLVILDAAVGIVLPRGGTLREEEIVWEPDTSGVKRTEKAISAFLRVNAPSLANHLAEYVRQYGGVVEGGRRKIYCSFLHKTDFEYGDILEQLERLSHGITVYDGGDHFFQLLYDPETDSCSELLVNGDA